MSLAGIVVAAGRGERFGGRKHLIEVGGVAIWERARSLLMAAGAGEIVVVGDVPGGIPGGERRRDSVAAGLARLVSGPEWVLVHDAARPLASLDMARRVVDRLIRGDADAVIPVVPVRDTIKRVEVDLVLETVDRSLLAAAQTPQGFRVARLRDAQASDSADTPDEAALLERAGCRVVTVPGDPGNLKLTFPEDLVVLEALL